MIKCRALQSSMMTYNFEVGSVNPTTVVQSVVLNTHVKFMQQYTHGVLVQHYDANPRIWTESASEWFFQRTRYFRVVMHLRDKLVLEPKKYGRDAFMFQKCFFIF